MLRAIETPPTLPPQAPTWLPQSTLEIMGQQVHAGWQEALNTPPPGGFTLNDYWLQAKRFIASHSTAVYFASAGLLALAVIGGRRRW